MLLHTSSSAGWDKTNKIWDGMEQTTERTNEQEDVGFIVGKFPSEKQVVAFSTVGPSPAIEEGLCALLRVPTLKRLDPSGAVKESRVQMPPPCSPCPSSAASPSAAVATAVTSVGVSSDRRLSPSAVGGEDAAVRGEGSPTRAAAVVKPLPVHGRPDQQAQKAVATSAKDRLLMETREALSISSSSRMARGGGAVALSGTRRSARYSSAPSVPGSGATATVAAAGGNLAAAAQLVCGGRVLTGPASCNGAAAATTSQPRRSGGYDRRHIPRTKSIDDGSGGGGGGRGRHRHGPPPAYKSSTAPCSAAGSVVDGDEPRSWPHGSGVIDSVGGHGQQKQVGAGAGAGGVMSRAGAHDDDAASTFDLLSPGAFKDGVAAMMAVLGRLQKPGPAEGEHGSASSSSGASSSSPSPPLSWSSSRSKPTSTRSSMSPAVVVVSSSNKQHGRVSVGSDAGGGGGGSIRDVENRNPDEKEQQQQPLRRAGVPPALVVPKSPSSSSLREGDWDLPAALVASLEANGILLPTPLQESVWKGGRGNAREDLLVHVRIRALVMLMCVCVRACVRVR